jgi:superfamily I DNA/RNA helicase
MQPTDEQLSILSAVRQDSRNLQIKALAGTGKTSTLRLIDGQINGKYNILYIVFNKRNAEEALEPNEDGSPKFSSTTRIKTLNGLGHGIWQQAQGKLTLDKNKTLTHFRELVKEMSKSEAAEAWAEYPNVKSGIEMAKDLGYIPAGKYPNTVPLCEWDAVASALDEEPSPLAKELIDALLTQSIKTAYKGYIDYNDQIYMPALFGGTYPRFPVVLIDEAQDLSPTNHAIVSKLCKQSRAICVGDPWQSIYGFRGAVQSGMEKLRDKFSMSEHDLSVSFRCPEAIVRAVRWHVPHMKWSKPGGRTCELRNPTPSSFSDGCAIICRNNAPLFRLALFLLAHGRSVSVHGSDIGPKVVGIMRKLGSEDMSQDSTLSAIADWEAERVAKGSKTASDIAECMRVFAGYGPTLKGATSYAEHLFAQKGTISLLTGHKAKGLEWNKVYHLDPWLLGESEQEKNLRYVITTRAKAELYEINSKEIRP